MANTLADVITLVEAALNKGTTYNSVVPGFVRKAAQWLEKNYTFKYMEQVDSSAFALVAAQYVYTQPARQKRAKLWRITLSDGSFIDLTKVDPKDVGGRQTRAIDSVTAADPTHPLAFYLQARTSFVLTFVPDTAYTAEFWYDQFSSWPINAYTTAVFAVTDVIAATVTAYSIDVTNATTGVTATYSGAVTGATGTLLATALQTALQGALDTNFTVSWAANVLTVQDASGRLLASASLTTSGSPVTGTTTVAPWLVTDADDLLVNTTVWLMAVGHLQDKDLADGYKELRDESLRIAFLSEEELIQGDNDTVMQYAEPE